MDRKLNDAEKRGIVEEFLKGNEESAAFISLYSDLCYVSNDFYVNINDRHELVDLSHSQVPEASRFIKSHALISRRKLQADLSKHFDKPISLRGADTLTTMTVQLMLMLDPNAKSRDPGTSTMKHHDAVSWEADETLVSFVERALNSIRETTSPRSANNLRDNNLIKAWKLRDRLGIRICSTDNIAEHLLSDGKENIFVFHHASFLKSQLKRAKAEGLQLRTNLADSLKAGILPPQFLLETLHSIQDVLFPYQDHSSKVFLKGLVRGSKFDSECMNYELYEYDVSTDFKYIYWQDRIENLHSLLDQRRGRNRLERAFERLGTQANAFVIAIFALIISIVVGIISIALSAAQLYISLMAWKHPVPQNS
ncbi:hypothetical protein PG993_007392 [Apiospora rasikravindrae]|uniref:Uncharacterized protein n=1 Tax=Apiospora rasikravindrae TaxID=990691 RepID=A0ABR1SXD0_9PEZI